MNKQKIAMTINGTPQTFEVDPDTKLKTLLRDNGFTSVKFGCGEGSCGACTIIMNGRAVLSCIMYAFQADGADVWTTEGVGTYENPHPFQQALVDSSAVQCGFCIPGMIMSAKAMFDETPVPDDDTIRLHLDGNLCRCTGYEKIWDALHKVVDDNRQKGGE